MKCLGRICFAIQQVYVILYMLKGDIYDDPYAILYLNVKKIPRLAYCVVFHLGLLSCYL
ncbi:hypothetical protein HanPSC8_Chr06g0232081 [Helianthus annuus]|nr:hypothetical protein HanPSC8_Chr06g0232081 [Helianthus annuus]